MYRSISSFTMAGPQNGALMQRFVSLISEEDL